ncbi:MAG: hypothetical protein V2A64_06825 [Candidatus Omnitrophota bacterium]
MLRNSFRQDKKAFFLRDVWHTVIILCALSLLYIFLTVLFDFITKKGLPAFVFAFMFLSFSLLVFMPLLFYSAIVCSLSFLFQKEEIHSYFSLPINKLAIFTVKLLQTYFHTNWMVFLGFFTFILAVQTYFKTTCLIYLTGSVSFLLFLLIPVCLAVTLVIIISRIIPFIQAKGILTVIGLLVGSILVTAIRLMQPEQLITAEGKMRLVSFVQNLHKPWMTILPSEWVTNILFAQVEKDLSGILINLLSLSILALISLLLVYFVGERSYKKIWADSVIISKLNNKNWTWEILLKIFPATLRGFIRKDLLTFYRDIVERGSLLILIPLTIVYLYSVYSLNTQIQKSAAEPLFSLLFIYLFNFFYSSVVIAGLSGRWVFPSVSIEGNSFNLIKGSPTSLKEFLKAKFLLGFIPLFLLGQVLILSSSLLLHLKFPLILVSVFTVTLLCWGITLICLILGIRLADFSITVPLDFALSIKGFLCIVWEFIFVAIVIALVGIPTALFLNKGCSRAFISCSIISIALIFVILDILRHSYRLSQVWLSKEEI